MTPNKERGEVALTLNGRTHILRPTFEAIVAIEAESGKSIAEASYLIGRGKGTLELVACVVRHGIIATGIKPQPTKEKVLEEVFKNGLSNLDMLAATTLFLMAALRGGVLPDEEGSGKTEAGAVQAESPSAAS